MWMAQLENISLIAGRTIGQHWRVKHSSLHRAPTVCGHNSSEVANSEDRGHDFMQSSPLLEGPAKSELQFTGSVRLVESLLQKRGQPSSKTGSSGSCHKANSLSWWRRDIEQWEGVANHGEDFLASGTTSSGLYRGKMAR